MDLLLARSLHRRWKHSLHAPRDAFDATAVGSGETHQSLTGLVNTFVPSTLTALCLLTPVVAS